MPKFAVTVKELVTYGIDVEADSAGEAEAIALEMMVQTDPDQFFLEVEERNVTFVMRKP